jgi:hypothetical protein
MRKIPTLYERNPDDRKHVIVGSVTPGCEWVIDGEGVPTRKWDGTCVMLDEAGGWWARREVKPDQEWPRVFRLESTDPVTRKTVGWVPMEGSSFAKWHAQAVERQANEDPRYATFIGAPGTFELIGPKINKSPDGFESHTLIRHGMHPVDMDYLGGQPPTPEGLIEFCRAEGWEGIVWHHRDGRMAKLKVRDIPASTPIGH